MTPLRNHHKIIWAALERFDADYLASHNIYFGGGTRIALELEEYRLSEDIDFFCFGANAYKAARESITSASFGPLLSEGQQLPLARGEIRADRDAIRCFILPDSPIKLELIRFDDQSLRGEINKLFPVPIVDRTSCFTTKLLANADRHSHSTKKDIFDICMMTRQWGSIPEISFRNAAAQYGENTILHGLRLALNEVHLYPHDLIEIGVNTLQINRALAEEIVFEVAPVLRSSLGLGSGSSPSPG